MCSAVGFAVAWSSAEGRQLTAAFLGVIRAIRVAAPASPTLALAGDPGVVRVRFLPLLLPINVDLCCNPARFVSCRSPRPGDHSCSGAKRTNAVILRSSVAECVCLSEPRIQLIGKCHNRRVRPCVGPTHRKSQGLLIALDCTYAASRIGGNFFPRSQDPPFGFIPNMIHT